MVVGELADGGTVVGWLFGQEGKMHTVDSDALTAVVDAVQVITTTGPCSSSK